MVDETVDPPVDDGELLAGKVTRCNVVDCDDAPGLFWSDELLPMDWEVVSYTDALLVAVLVGDVRVVI